jgi:hypothetical protein
VLEVVYVFGCGIEIFAVISSKSLKNVLTL